jgi:NADP-dependent 3-hydroxy acid dehydrogenase YdfG
VQPIFQPASRRPNSLDRAKPVTGASSGIGEATALAFAKAGAKVDAMARRKDRLYELAKKAGSDGANVLSIEGDVSVRKDAERVVKETHEKWGKLDILVNNAGIMLLGPFDEVDIEEWERMVKVNVLRSHSHNNHRTRGGAD